MLKKKAMIFRKYGGTYQLEISRVAHLEQVLVLDESKWVATSAPVSSLHADADLLAMVDSDRNGRIRSDELKEAISWTLRMLRDRNGLLEARDCLQLDAIDDSHEEGRALRAGAEKILVILGKQSATSIAPEDLADRKRLLMHSASNGDGVICPGDAGDPRLESAIREIMRVSGSELDASGARGISQEILASFLTEARAHLAWAEEAEPAGDAAATLLPLGPDTDAAFRLLSRTRAKIEQFFALCRLGAIYPAALKQPFEGGEGWSRMESAALDEWVGAAPLATPNAQGVLHFEAAINPLFVADLKAFREGVLRRLFAGAADTMDAAQWSRLREIFQPYRDWLARKKGASVAPLGLENLRRFVSGDFAGRLQALIHADRQVAENLAQIDKILRLCLYQKWLFKLVNNFVSFPALYHTRQTALFELGSLVMDGRRFNFSVKVADPKTHAKIAESSNIFLVYCLLERNQPPRRCYIATAVTAGGKGNLSLGKRGIFFGIGGKVWDATVVKTVAAPISMSEAMKQPFVNLISFLGAKIEKISGSSEKQLEATLESHLGKIESSVTTAIKDSGEGVVAPQKPDAAKDYSGVIMSVGVAVAAIGSSFAFIAQTLSQMHWSKLAIALGVGLAMVLVPTAVIGSYKLRRRDLAAILEASGWAINARMRLKRRLQRFFTQKIPRPPGSKFTKISLDRRDQPLP